MKKLIFSFLLLSFPSLSAAEELTLKVDGMTCESCAQAIKRSLGKIATVEEYSADVENKTIKLTVPDDEPLSDEDVKKAIDKAGYELLSVERKK